MGITRYTWDITTDSVLQESDGTGAVQATYTRRPERYGPLLSQYRSSQTNYFHFDALGSTRALTNDSQVVTDAYTYDAWGSETISSGISYTPFKWNGELGFMNELISSMFIVRDRIFPSTLARWLSSDPYGFVDAYNLYQYAFNAPTYFNDPSGDQVCGEADEAPNCNQLQGNITNYGCYCGNRGAVPEGTMPIDAIDRCCRGHDECYCEHDCDAARFRGRVIYDGRPECEACDQTFCRCLWLVATCNRYAHNSIEWRHCRRYRNWARWFFGCTTRFGL